ncbi:MAG: cupredoxin domain-containing protein [Chloroflexi bacterium]|nr:cupredoxin domain-containing protein [Chloroflexota bacterium]
MRVRIFLVPEEAPLISTREGFMNALNWLSLGTAAMLGFLAAASLLLAQPAQAAATVSVTDDAFVPQNLTVLLGDTVTWTNSGVRLHTATSDLAYWNSGTLSPGQSYSYTFLSVGAYSYYCSFSVNQEMKGSITVLAPTPTPAPPTATATPTVLPTPTPTAVPATNQISLSAGWNLISFRTELAIPSTVNVFTRTPEVTKVFHFGDGAWSYAFRGPTGWSGDLQQLSDGKGYWAFATEPATLVYQPYAGARPRSYSLAAGWRLIGYSSSLPYRPVDAYLTSLQDKWTMLYRYDPTRGWELAKPASSGFDGFSAVSQGEGYWVYLTAAGTLAP